MPCTSPLHAWLKHPSLGTGLCFTQEESQLYIDTLKRTGSKVLARLNAPMHISCRKCISCRIQQSRYWAVRMQHEASLFNDNCFLTLTINDKHLLSRENPYTLVLKEQQDFFKYLRHHIYPQKVRFFACGEYGDLKMRPHYHAILFGYNFPDRKHFKNVRGNPMYVSETLSNLWPQGFAVIQDVTFDSAAYVARYCTKKLTGDLAKERYLVTDPETGEFWERRPDYSTMSRRPGIGDEWIKRYKSDVFAFDATGKCIKDELIVDSPKGKFAMHPPKFYDKVLTPAELEAVTLQRTLYAEKNQLSEERLDQLAASSAHRQKRITRDITNDESIYK